MDEMETDIAELPIVADLIGASVVVLRVLDMHKGTTCTCHPEGIAVHGDPECPFCVAREGLRAKLQLLSKETI